MKKGFSLPLWVAGAAKSALKKLLGLTFQNYELIKIPNEKRKFHRERFFSSWREWFSLVNTQQAIMPFIVIIFISSFIGWSLGISKNSCNPYFEQNIEKLN